MAFFKKGAKLAVLKVGFRMGSVRDSEWDEGYSVIGDKGDVGFLDFEDDRSLHSYDLLEEGPVVISVPFPFIDGKPQYALVGETFADSITIKNTTGDSRELWSVRIFSSSPEDSYLLSLMKPPSTDADEESVRRFVGSTSLEDRVLQPGQTLTIWISCKPKDIGLHTSVIHFDLGEEKIERVAFLLAEDKVSQALFSAKPYARAPSRGKKFSHDQYVAGKRPPPPSSHGFKYRLPEYPIPQDIREIIESKQVPDVIMEGLSRRNYVSFFSTLIVMEEIHLEEEMRAHDMECVTMRWRGNHFLSLEVPALAERRPSLVVGDYILAQLVASDHQNDNHAYQGYIHRIEADEIFLKFNKTLHGSHRDDDLYNVSFSYNRTNMRRLYHAVQSAENLGPDILFPSHSPHKRVIKTTPLRPLNQNLNREQALSVEKILGCRGGPPYIIHGPPGTGKTMTIVEAILQLYASQRKTRILVCASSNSAADHVLQKLFDREKSGVRENELFRLNAMSRPYEDVKPEFIRFCFFDDMVFKCPPVKALLRYKIIVSTYMSASLLCAEGIRRGHFTHIFLDEAGQASEPETMIPISNLCARETVIALAGDPKQLGPVIYSKDAESYGLGKSYLERLFECDNYNGGDENYVTKLLRNYRCHPAILELPSDLFYDGELIACKEETEETESTLYDLVDLPNNSFPVLFIGIQGCDEREGSNPSWFNRIEASKVVDIIRKLNNDIDLDEGDIGVITPYRQQVLKLKKAFESLDMPNVKVGSVEQFQGQERRIIIISTVRSTIKHNEFDRVHNLGFLSNPRRFNVAITRAKSLLIIVGNPHIINKDPHWDKLLRYCVENGSYQGCPLPALEEHYQADELGEYNGGNDIPNQYSNGAEWDKEIPKQFSNDVEWDEYIPPNQESNEAEWDEYIPPNQESNGTGWDETYPSQYTNDVGWEKENVPNQSSSEANWGNDVSNHSNNGRWGDDVLNKLSDDENDDAEWGDADFSRYSDVVECNEDPASKLVTNEVKPAHSSSGGYPRKKEWGECSSKSYSNRARYGNMVVEPSGWDD